MNLPNFPQIVIADCSSLIINLALFVFSLALFVVLLDYFKYGRAECFINNTLDGLQQKIEQKKCVKIGISTGIFYDKNIFDCILEIRDAGFDTIEIWTSPVSGEYVHFDPRNLQSARSLNLLINALGLKVHSLHSPLTDEYNIAAHNEICRRQAVEEILRIMDVSDFFGAKHLVIHPASGDYSLAQSRKSLEEICSRNVSKDVRLCIENTLPNSLGCDSKTLLLLTEGLWEKVGICFDSSHACLSTKGSPHIMFSELGPRIKTLHLSDNYLERDDHFMIGDGKINWHRLLQSMRQSSYDGLYLLELSKESIERGFVSDLNDVYSKAREIFYPY